MNYTYIYLIGRVIFGLYFAFSGFNHFKNRAMLEGYTAAKGIPFPKVSNFLAGAFLLLGGLGIIFDYQLQAACALIFVFLVLSTVMVHNFWNDTDPASKGSNMQNFLKNVALIGATMMLYVDFI